MNKKQYIELIGKSILALYFLISFSCAGLPSPQQQNTNSNIAQSAQKKYPNSHEKVFWNTSTSGGDLVIVGVGGLQMYDTDSIQKALEDAARKVSLFAGLRGATVYYEHIGTAFWDYIVENSTKINYNEDYAGYIDQLEYDPDKDIIINEKGAFVRTRYKLSNSFHIMHPSSGSESEKPDWVDNPPSTINNFIVGVGYARPQMYVNRTYVASYEAAIAAIVSKGSSSIDSKNVQYQGSGYFDYDDVRENTVTASAAINGFYVLQVWIDPQNGGVYTLAVAQSAEGL
jgi:hypothetical protein